MTIPAEKPTGIADVDELLAALAAGLRVMPRLGLAAMYLYGSLATGDFDHATSDVDVLVVTRDLVGADLVPDLAALHEDLRARGLPLAAKLEGAYLPQAMLARHDESDPDVPIVNEGTTCLGHLGPDWVLQRHVVREHPVVALGPDPREHIDPVTPDQVRDAVRGIVETWWAPHVEHRRRLDERGYRDFAVQTMCRALHGLEHGTVVSKPAAAAWAAGVLEPGQVALVQRATSHGGTTPADEQSTVELIRQVVARAREHA